jgi:hypothetical protein
MKTLVLAAALLAASPAYALTPDEVWHVNSLEQFNEVFTDMTKGKVAKLDGICVLSLCQWSWYPT